MNRFFLPANCFRGERVVFHEEMAHQIRNVLRLRVGQSVYVLDNTGWVYEVVLDKVTNEKAVGGISQKYFGETEPKLKLTLFLSLTQREKFEWALQKCTEVGVTSFVPVITNRSLVRGKEKVTSKYQRWRRILQEAAEQSQRVRLPFLHDTLFLSEALDHVKGSLLPSAMLWEGETGLSLQQWVGSFESEEKMNADKGVGIFVGPEGGYAQEEVEAAQAAGVKPVSLGKRILRMETAAIVGAALVLNAFDELS